MTATEALTHLVNQSMGEGAERRHTLRSLRDRCIDPETGYQPAVETIAKIRRGQDIKPNPRLIRALAAGLGVPVERVQLAAAEQYLGYTVTEVGGAMVVHPPGGPADESRARTVVERWDREEGEESV